MAVTITTRNAAGEIVSVPFEPNGGMSAADGTAEPSGTDVSGVAGPASTEAGSPSAPPAEPPAPAVGETAGDLDDEPEPEVATVDYVARRVKRITGRMRDQEKRHAEREQAWTQERAHLQGQLDAAMRMLSGATPTLPDTPQGPPQAEQFTSHEDFVRATARYEAQEVARTQQQQATQQSQAQAMQQQLLEREQAFRQAHPDFDQVISTGLRGRIAPHVQQALMVLPDGPAMAYVLATQPEALSRLNTLPPVQVIAELARMTVPPAGSPPAATPETTTTNGAAPPAPQAPAPPLPPPPMPLSGMGQGAPSGATPDMSQAEFRRLWNSGWRPSPRDLGRQ